MREREKEKESLREGGRGAGEKELEREREGGEQGSKASGPTDRYLRLTASLTLLPSTHQVMHENKVLKRASMSIKKLEKESPVMLDVSRLYFSWLHVCTCAHRNRLGVGPSWRFFDENFLPTANKAAYSGQQQAAGGEHRCVFIVNPSVCFLVQYNLTNV